MLPQIIYLCLALLGLGISMAKHGQSKSNYHFGVDLISSLLVLGLLYWGGFFNAFFK
jgi:hypothetical protein